MSQLTFGKFLWKALLGVLIIGALISFLIYATVKTKSTSLDQVAPFSSLIGETVVLQQDVDLLREVELKLYTHDAYPYLMTHLGHARYQQHQDRMANAPSEIELVVRIPAGTEVTFEKAVNYTNGVSGFSYPSLFGTLSHEGKQYKVDYVWGEEMIGLNMKDKEETWRFAQAAWQDKVDENYYAVPKGNVW